MTSLQFTLKGSGATVTLPMCSTDGVSRPITLVGGTLTSLGGAQTSQVTARKRTFTLNFGNLDDADYDDLVQFVDGRQGRGPFTLTDPRDTSGTSYQVNLQAGDSPLTDDSTISGIRFGVALTLVEV